jgi:hypothetical protein
MKLRLLRDYHGTDCTQGILHIGEHRLHTMERPWVPSKNSPCGTKGVSCVSPGVYQLYRHDTEAHSHTFALVNPTLWTYHFDEDVPVGQLGLARTCVLIHAANYASELRGCIAPGLERSRDGARRMVTNSRAAMHEIQSLVPWTSGEHSLEIA